MTPQPEHTIGAALSQALAGKFQQALSLHQQGQLGQAEVLCREILQAQPEHFDALHFLGLVAGQRGQPQTALELFAQAIALNPNRAAMHADQGIAFHTLGRLEEALASFDQAVTLQPDYPVALYCRGVVFNALARYEEALASFDRALAIQPGYVEAHFQRSLARLVLGDFARGWADYEWRLQLLSRRKMLRSYAQPRWRGEEALAGKTILVYAEQGLGDTIQFGRYARLLAARGARVVLEVQPILKTLLAQLAGVSALVGAGEALPEFDFHCPLLSLPGAFGTDLDSIPAAQQYLAADGQRVRAWETRLGARRGTRVGLVWAGNPRVEHDATRSVALKSLTRLAVPGVELISLQKELRPGDRELLAAHPEIRHLGAELTDFADTAAVIATLDLVISVDTVVAHLAGALGQPVWILQAHTPDFRWLLDRDDSPWYPSARLFRQPRFADWESVIDRVQLALRQIV